MSRGIVFPGGVGLDLFSQVKSTIERYKMILPGDTILAGVSGGADSVALLHLLNRLKEELRFKLYAGHLNHMFRGEEAEGDARLVESLAQQWSIPLVNESINVPEYLRKHGLSPQAGAREVRYLFFEKNAGIIGANRVALGHHADDQAETVLLNLIRGSGISGLGGIPPVREGRYIRPLLDTRREQIELYCKAFGIPYRMDSSNLKMVYLRNRIRLELIPLLEGKYNPAVVKSLNRLAGIARDEDEYMDSVARAAFGDVVQYREAGRVMISIEKIESLPPAIRRRIIRMACMEVAGFGGMPSFDHVEAVWELAESQVHQGKLDLPGGLRLLKRYRFLEIITEKEGRQVPFYRHKLQIPGSTVIPEIGRVMVSRVLEVSQAGDPRQYCDQEALLDLDSIRGTVLVRKRMEGDSFYPLGMKGRAKLKNIFIDLKVPREDRDAIPIVTCGNDIVWVAGFRPDRRFIVTETTGTCLHLKLMESC